MVLFCAQFVVGEDSNKMHQGGNFFKISSNGGGGGFLVILL